MSRSAIDEVGAYTLMDRLEILDILGGLRGKVFQRRFTIFKE